MRPIFFSICLIPIVVLGQLSFQPKSTFYNPEQFPFTYSSLADDPDETDDAALQTKAKSFFYAGVANQAVYNSILVPLMFNAQSAKNIVGGNLLGIGLTLFPSIFMAKDQYISIPMARMYIAGSNRGMIHGALIGHDYGKTTQKERTAPYAIIGFLMSNLEAYSGFLYAQKNELNITQTHSILRFSDLFLATAGTITLQKNYKTLFDFEKGKPPYLLPTAIASIAGYAAGYKYIENNDRTYGDLRYMFNNFLMYGAIAEIYTGRGNDELLVTTPTILSAIGGTVLGHYLTENTQLTRAQSTGAVLGSYGAGMFGYLISYLLDPNDDFTPQQARKYLKVGAAFALGTNLLLREKYKKENTGSNVFSEMSIF